MVALVGKKLRKEQREQFLVILLNARHEVTAVETVSIGLLNASIVHPREVFKPALLASAASVVLVHNHPSGDPEPSGEDLSITKRLVECGELIGVGVLDHVIVASRAWSRFARGTCCSRVPSAQRSRSGRPLFGRPIGQRRMLVAGFLRSRAAAGSGSKVETGDVVQAAVMLEFCQRLIYACGGEDRLVREPGRDILWTTVIG